MGKRVALVILILAIVGGVLWYRSSLMRKGPPIPTTCLCDEAPAEILVSAPSGPLPRTCVYPPNSTTAGTMLKWRATDGSRLTIKFPDWGTQKPTTAANPYPAAQCPGNPGTFCVSGAFAAVNLNAACTEIPYSITTTVGSTPTVHFGRVIIIKP